MMYRLLMSNEDDRHAEEARRFGENLRGVRTRRGLSQKELADQMAALRHKWHPSTVARLEDGERRATWMEVRDLARILDVTVDRFTWAPAEEAEAAIVNAAAASLRSAAEKTALAVAELHAARHTGKRRAEEYAGSKYEQARDAARSLDQDVETITLDSATAAGTALWERERNG
jgi:transcriptional regulator with XRE-family HTH domain